MTNTLGDCVRDPRTPPTIRIATYNVHGCVGLDRRQDAGRVARVLRDLDADIIGLQEVLGQGADLETMTVFPVTSKGDAPGRDQLAVFADHLGYEARAGANLMREGRRFGNALLSRHPIVSARRLNLAHGNGREPRGAIDAVISAPAGVVRVLVTHFGLGGPERAWQAARLAEYLAEPPPGVPALVPAATIVLGDFNDMWPPSKTYHPMIEALGGRPPWRRTWPAPAPILPLDKIWPGPGAHLEDAQAWRGPGARVASDHLPLVGRLALDPVAPNFHATDPRTALRSAP
nr:endonuclease/exonuclease/phosphatase family protein [Roseospira navarrensis]